MLKGLTSNTMSLEQELAYCREMRDSALTDWGTAYWHNEVETRERALAEQRAAEEVA